MFKLFLCDCWHQVGRKSSSILAFLMSSYTFVAQQQLVTKRAVRGRSWETKQTLMWRFKAIIWDNSVSHILMASKTWLSVWQITKTYLWKNSISTETVKIFLNNKLWITWPRRTKRKGKLPKDGIPSKKMCRLKAEEAPPSFHTECDKGLEKKKPSGFKEKENWLDWIIDNGLIMFLFIYFCFLNTISSISFVICNRTYLIPSLDSRFLSRPNSFILHLSHDPYYNFTRTSS